MKKLTKSREKILFGVCGGIAQYFNIDPSFSRIIWAVLTLISFGTFVFIYIVCAVIMPAPDSFSNDDVEHMKRANPEDDVKSYKSGNNGDVPHSDKDFDSFFKSSK